MWTVFPVPELIAGAVLLIMWFFVFVTWYVLSMHVLKSNSTDHSYLRNTVMMRWLVLETAIYVAVARLLSAPALSWQAIVSALSDRGLKTFLLLVLACLGTGWLVHHDGMLKNYLVVRQCYTRELFDYWLLPAANFFVLFYDAIAIAVNFGHELWKWWTRGFWRVLLVCGLVTSDGDDLTLLETRLADVFHQFFYGMSEFAKKDIFVDRWSVEAVASAVADLAEIANDLVFCFCQELYFLWFDLVFLLKLPETHQAFDCYWNFCLACVQWIFRMLRDARLPDFGPLAREACCAAQHSGEVAEIGLLVLLESTFGVVTVLSQHVPNVTEIPFQFLYQPAPAPSPAPAPAPAPGCPNFTLPIYFHKPNHSLNVTYGPVPLPPPLRDVLTVRWSAIFTGPVCAFFGVFNITTQAFFNADSVLTNRSAGEPFLQFGVPLDHLRAAAVAFGSFPTWIHVTVVWYYWPSFLTFQLYQSVTTKEVLELAFVNEMAHEVTCLMRELLLVVVQIFALISEFPPLLLYAIFKPDLPIQPFLDRFFGAFVDYWFRMNSALTLFFPLLHDLASCIGLAIRKINDPLGGSIENLLHMFVEALRIFLQVLIFLWSIIHFRPFPTSHDVEVVPFFDYASDLAASLADFVRQFDDNGEFCRLPCPNPSNVIKKGFVCCLGNFVDAGLNVVVYIAKELTLFVLDFFALPTAQIDLAQVHVPDLESALNFFEDAVCDLLCALANLLPFPLLCDFSLSSYAGQDPDDPGSPKVITCNSGKNCTSDFFCAVFKLFMVIFHVLNLLLVALGDHEPMGGFLGFVEIVVGLVVDAIANIILRMGSFLDCFSCIFDGTSTNCDTSAFQVSALIANLVQELKYAVTTIALAMFVFVLFYIIRFFVRRDAPGATVNIFLNYLRVGWGGIKFITKNVVFSALLQSGFFNAAIAFLSIDDFQCLVLQVHLMQMIIELNIITLGVLALPPINLCCWNVPIGPIDACRPFKRSAQDSAVSPVTINPNTANVSLPPVVLNLDNWLHEGGLYSTADIWKSGDACRGRMIYLSSLDRTTTTQAQKNEWQYCMAKAIWGKPAASTVSKIVWNACDDVMRSYVDLRVPFADLSVSDAAEVLQCLQLRVVVGAFADKIDAADWFPVDFLYNPLRPWLFAAETIGGAEILVQYMSDRTFPPTTVASAAYKEWWRSNGFDVRHLNRSFSSEADFANMLNSTRLDSYFEANGASNVRSVKQMSIWFWKAVELFAAGVESFTDSTVSATDLSTEIFRRMLLDDDSMDQMLNALQSQLIGRFASLLKTTAQRWSDPTNLKRFVTTKYLDVAGRSIYKSVRLGLLAAFAIGSKWYGSYGASPEIKIQHLVERQDSIDGVVPSEGYVQAVYDFWKSVPRAWPKQPVEAAAKQKQREDFHARRMAEVDRVMIGTPDAARRRAGIFGLYEKIKTAVRSSEIYDVLQATRPTEEKKKNDGRFAVAAVAPVGRARRFAVAPVGPAPRVPAPPGTSSNLNAALTYLFVETVNITIPPCSPPGTLMCEVNYPNCTAYDVDWDCECGSNVTSGTVPCNCSSPAEHFPCVVPFAQCELPCNASVFSNCSFACDAFLPNCTSCNASLPSCTACGPSSVNCTYCNCRSFFPGGPCSVPEPTCKTNFTFSCNASVPNCTVPCGIDCILPCPGESLTCSPTVPFACAVNDASCNSYNETVCESCTFLDRTLHWSVRAADRATYNYLHGHFVREATKTKAFYLYSTDPTAPVRVGRRFGVPPRWPCVHPEIHNFHDYLGDTYVKIRFTDFQQLFFDSFPPTGNGTLASLADDGINGLALRFANALFPFVVEWVDRFYFFFTAVPDNKELTLAYFTAAFDFLILCNYETDLGELNGEQRRFEIMEVVLFSFAMGVLLSLFVAQVFPPSMQILFSFAPMGTIGLILFFSALFVYSYSFFCYPYLILPLARDVFELVAFAFFPKCEWFFSGLINERYDATNCQSCENVRNMTLANCREKLRFRSVVDNAVFYLQYYHPDLAQWFRDTNYPFFNLLQIPYFAAQFDKFYGLNWNDPVVYSQHMACMWQITPLANYVNFQFLVNLFLLFWPFVALWLTVGSSFLLLIYPIFRLMQAMAFAMFYVVAKAPYGSRRKRDDELDPESVETSVTLETVETVETAEPSKANPDVFPDRSDPKRFVRFPERN